MYENYYQLTSNPFRLAPDPNFCFTHSGYKRAREYLEYALAQGEGFVMVTGRPGTGKTMLAETFIHGVDIGTVTAKRITASSYGADDLLRAVAYAYELDVTGVDKATLRHQIQQYFLQQEKAGRRVLLIIDEAQALQHSALEELRILADLQTESRLMLQLFLIGQETLQDLMRAPEMEQFQQRVIANYHLVPLNLLDARAYIEYRLLLAGWRGDPDFSSEAVLSIYRLSKGVPRHINKICNRLLLLGYGKGSHSIEDGDVNTISLEMRDELLTPMGAEVLPAHTDSVVNIAEVRDGMITGEGLAIHAGNLSQSVTAVSEASMQAESRKVAFMQRHQHAPQVWTEPRADDDRPPEYGATEGGHSTLLELPAAIFQRQGANDDTPLPGRFKWRETLVVTGALLAITTISIAALPGILGGKSTADMTTQRGIADYEYQDQAGIGRNATAKKAVFVVDTERAAQATPEAVYAGGQPANTGLYAQPLFIEAIDTSIEAGPAPVEAASKPEQERRSPVDSGSIRPAAVVISAAPHPVADAAAISRLLAQGRQSINDYRLLTPASNNAYGYFGEVLAIDPGNKQAQAGIRDILDTYAILINDAIRRNNTDRASLFAARGLSIQPDSRELLALKRDIDSMKLAAAQARAVSLASADPASKIAADDAAGVDSSSGVSSFFRRHGADNQQQNFGVPFGWDEDG